MSRMKTRIKHNHHYKKEKLTVTVEVDGKRTSIRYPMPKKMRIVVIINNQTTNAANTTQIASGAGRSSAAGNNAAIASSNTQQQQGVGAGGKAENRGMRRKQSEPHVRHSKWKDREEIVVVLTNQTNLSGQTGTSAATQVASGGGTYSASGTNGVIESSNTKQQHSVGGGPGAEASNEGMNSEQIET